ncbi:tumor suppressor candidate 5-like protein [Brachionus plicatilis]|uniref:Tumor suppressor candidate 5-like protein n=1 Tax=Brachionus plicatilis TaxID=10195 RepID=A0A3M7SME9_BRAPC|nr:tumor suppressor candidate 5-like protein [Brachionus plicatilis]
MSYNSNVDNEANIEKGFLRPPTLYQPKKYSSMTMTAPQPDYMNWSTASLFVCFVWGIFAYQASNKVRKFNRMKAYDQAAIYSQSALKYNKSAVACCIIMFLILGVPLAIALAVQGSITKFPNARMFFG